MQPTPVVAVNRAVAVSFADGPSAGLALLDELGDERALRDYVPLLAARADLLRRAGDREAADAAYAEAIDRSANAGPAGGPGCAAEAGGGGGVVSTEPPAAAHRGRP